MTHLRIQSQSETRSGGNHVSNADDITVNDGLPTNYVNIVDGSQPHARKSIDYDCS